MSDTSNSATVEPNTTSMAGTWTLDPAHSNVEFAVTHLMISKVRGRFSTMSGTVVTDGTPEGSRVAVEIGTASIDTRDNGRDTHLRSADFFDVEQFPTIRFVSTSVGPTRDGEFRLSGDLTIHGVTKAIDIEVTREGTGRDPWGGERAGFSGKARIDRRDFGLTWNQVLEAGGMMVSNDVRITFDIQLTRKAD